MNRYLATFGAQLPGTRFEWGGEDLTSRLHARMREYAGLSPAQTAAFADLMTTARDLTDQIEDAHSRQGWVGPRFVFKPWLTTGGLRTDEGGTVGEPDVLRFPQGYRVSLEYESHAPAYRRSRYQIRFLMMVRALMADATGTVFELNRKGRPQDKVVRWMAMNAPEVSRVMHAYPPHPRLARDIYEPPRVTTESVKREFPELGALRRSVRSSPYGRSPYAPPKGHPLAGLTKADERLGRAVERLLGLVHCMMPVRLAVRPLNLEAVTPVTGPWVWVLNPAWFESRSSGELTGASFTVKRTQGPAEVSIVTFPAVDVLEGWAADRASRCRPLGADPDAPLGPPPVDAGAPLDPSSPDLPPAAGPLLPARSRRREERREAGRSAIAPPPGRRGWDRVDDLSMQKVAIIVAAFGLLGTMFAVSRGR